MYQVITSHSLLDEFIDTYLTDDEAYNQFLTTLSHFPHTRPFWGNTRFKYIVSHHIYFLYEIDDVNKFVFILGVKFNNKRKTFNFSRTSTQRKTLKKWIENKKTGIY